MIWNPEIELADRQKIEGIQLQRLRETVQRVCDHVPFYAKRLGNAGLNADSIQSLSDLQTIPFTVKQDMRDHYPYGSIWQSP